VSDFFYFYKPPPPPPTQPTGPQPTAWLLAGDSAVLDDYRGTGYSNVSGELPVAATYGPNNKKAWVYDGYTQIAITNHGLHLSNKVTLAAQFTSADYNNPYQKYFATLGNGSGAGPAHFDTYTSFSQYIFRNNSASGLTGGTGHYLRDINEPNALALWANLDGPPAPNFKTITPLAADRSELITDAGQIDPGPYANEPLFIFSGGYNVSIPFFPGSLLRSVLVWNEDVAPAKVREWWDYLDYQP
jgi:hypothetical protein